MIERNILPDDNSPESVTRETDKFLLRALREQLAADPNFGKKFLGHLTTIDPELARQIPAIADDLASRVEQGDIDVKSALIDIAMAIRKADMTQQLLESLEISIPDNLEEFIPEDFQSENPTAA
jgi:hypothetical protein